MDSVSPPSSVDIQEQTSFRRPATYFADLSFSARFGIQTLSSEQFAQCLPNLGGGICRAS
jgi:hypothetical protein